MRRFPLWVALFFVVVLAVSGCQKQNQDTIGFADANLDVAEELAQLPHASMVPQQGAIEVLPIETTPVTPSLMTTTATSGFETAAQTAVSAGSLSYNQKIQAALRNAGLYTGNIDGKIGPASRKAIETFQTNNGLKADGKVGPLTWAKLEPYVSGSTTDTSDSSSAIQ